VPGPLPLLDPPVGGRGCLRVPGDGIHPPHHSRQLRAVATNLYYSTLLYYSTFVSDHGPACQITVRVIDFHAHLVPGFYRDAAAEAGYAIMTTNGLPLLDGSGC
jgi:hypothetical protein